MRKAGLSKHAICHTPRRSFAIHLLANGYDIRTVEELLRHRSVKTNQDLRTANSTPLAAGVVIRTPEGW